MENEVLVKVEGLSKKFCKDLKTSLWYGFKDIVSGVTQNYDNGSLRKNEFWALRDISFELRRGECLGLIGHNGAGKSTLLKILNGLINPDEGEIVMNGRVGALIELGAGFNPILTGRENIYNNGAVLGFTRKEIDEKIEEIIDFSEIRQFIDTPVQNYSSGMKVRLGFSIASQMEPDILIIDEVLAVGDVGFRFKCLNAISELMKKAAVIFVSHSMPLIYRVCNEVMLLDHGRNVINTNKVGIGVEKYYQMFEGGKKNIAGTGEAILQELELRSDQKSAKMGEKIQVAHGGTIDIKVKIQIDPNISEVALQLVIWNHEMLPVLDVMGPEKHGFIVKNEGSNIHTLELQIPNLTLNNGKHSVSVMINSPDLGVSYCRYDNAAEIYMLLHTASAATHVCAVDWNLIK